MTPTYSQRMREREKRKSVWCEERQEGLHDTRVSKHHRCACASPQLQFLENLQQGMPFRCKGLKRKTGEMRKYGIVGIYKRGSNVAIYLYAKGVLGISVRTCSHIIIW